MEFDIENEFSEWLGTIIDKHHLIVNDEYANDFTYEQDFLNIVSSIEDFLKRLENLQEKNDVKADLVRKYET